MEASIDCVLTKGMFESERCVTFRNSDDEICVDTTQCFDDTTRRAMVYVHSIDNEDDTMLISFPNQDGTRRWVCKAIVHGPIKGWWQPEKEVYLEKEVTMSHFQLFDKYLAFKNEVIRVKAYPHIAGFWRVATPDYVVRGDIPESYFYDSPEEAYDKVLASMRANQAVLAESIARIERERELALHDVQDTVQERNDS